MKKFTYSLLIAFAAILFSGTAFGQITQVGTAQSSANSGTTITITKPSGIQVGDIMIANITQNETSGGIDLGDNATSSGWILIDGRALNNAENPEYWGTLLYKVAIASDVTATNYAFALDPQADGGVGAIVAFRGVDVTGGVTATGAAGGPFDVDPGIINNINTDNSLNASAITTTTTNAAVIMFGLIGDNPNVTDNSWSTTSPGALTELFDVGTSNGDDNAVAAAWAIKANTGSTGAGSATLSASDANGSLLIALKEKVVPPSVVINPPALSITTILVGNSVNLTATRNANSNWPGGNGNFQFTWSSTGPAAVSFTGNPTTITGTSNATTASGFSVAGTYTVTCTVQEQGGGVTVASFSKTVEVLASAPTTANLWATSSNGTVVSSFVVANGTYFSGPSTIFNPTFGGPNGGSSTAALGRTDKPTPASGHFYYLPNTGSNNGVIDIYGATANGSSIAVVGTVDLNGASNNSLGYVRLGMGPDGTGWILAGDGSNVYLAKFVPNGILPATVTIEDNNGITLVGGAASTFQNGDLCISGNGNIFALANDGNGVTQIFKGAPTGNSTTLTKVFDLVDNNGAAFTGSVNGVAFDLVGSLYLSTAAGLYYVDAATVNGPAGTVGCFLVQAQTGLQDLASNVFPVNSPLPVDLISFAGAYSNQKTNLNWVTENLQDFDRFEVERSSDGSNFATVATKAPVQTAARTTYLHTDDLSAVNGTVFYYRLKMIDMNGQFKYSNVILVRKDGTIKGIRINPNPVVSGGAATLRFEATAKGIVEFRIVDMAGRMVLKQQNNVAEGINSVQVNNLNRLQPGTYILQMNDGTVLQSTKFIIAQ